VRVGNEASSLDFDEAISIVDEPARCESWRPTFGASAGWVGLDEVAVPAGDALVALCRSWDFPAVAVQGLLDRRRDWEDPRIRRLGAHVQWMIAQRYTPIGSRQLGWPAVFSRTPLFYAYAALGLARRVAAQQAAMGIDARISAATLRDIGQQIFLHHRVYGELGMNKGWWLCHHLSHHLFRLGRLQFQRARAAERVGQIGASEPFLDVHIPEDGPLDPDACDASFTRSRTFFDAHFPDERATWLVCSSWLLDPVLQTLLPEASNILAFQHRFELHHLSEGPAAIFEFAFDRPDLDHRENPDLTSLPRDTRLRAAIVEHYGRGGIIRMGIGTIRR